MDARLTTGSQSCIYRTRARRIAPLGCDQAFILLSPHNQWLSSESCVDKCHSVQIFNSTQMGLIGLASSSPPWREIGPVDTKDDCGRDSVPDN